MKKIIALLFLLALTPKAHAIYDPYTPCNHVAYQSIAGNVTSPTGVLGTSLVYVTMTSKVKVYVYNPTTATARVFFSNVSYAAAGNSLNAAYIPTLTGRLFEGYQFNWLHMFFPAPNGSIATTLPIIENCY